jgi:hypothetical protein
MLTSDVGRARAAVGVEQFQLETLESLACGCVVAIQSVRPSGVTVVSLEAKGPHCPFRLHRVNKVIRLGESLDSYAYEDGDDFAV